MKNTAKYAWSFSRNSSFLRGLFFYAAPCTEGVKAHKRVGWSRNVCIHDDVCVTQEINIRPTYDEQMPGPQPNGGHGDDGGLDLVS